jgi:ABC-type methionine transport system permease subunit
VNILWLLVILLVVFSLVGAPGLGPWQHSYGYYPSGLGLVLVIVLLIVLLR